MVNFVARAVGTTFQPSFSNWIKESVLIASISGTIKCGFSFSTIDRMDSPSSMEITWLLCAICIAGAFSYRSTAIVSTPKRCASIATSFPSSPEPNSNSLVELLANGVPIEIM